MLSTLCNENKLLLVTPHHLKSHLQQLLELCCLLLLLDSNNPSTLKFLGCTCRRCPQIQRTCCPSCSRVPPPVLLLACNGCALVLLLLMCSGCTPLPIPLHCHLLFGHHVFAPPPHASCVAVQPPPLPLCVRLCRSLLHLSPPPRARQRRRHRSGRRPAEARQPPELLEPASLRHPQPHHVRHARRRRSQSELRGTRHGIEGEGGCRVGEEEPLGQHHHLLCSILAHTHRACDPRTCTHTPPPAPPLHSSSRLMHAHALVAAWKPAAPPGSCRPADGAVSSRSPTFCRSQRTPAAPIRRASTPIHKRER